LHPGDLFGHCQIEPSPHPEFSITYIVYYRMVFSLIEELIRTITKFGGTVNEDVLEWLKNIDEVFDRVQLQPSNKYIAAQSYLTKTAALWFRFHKSNILDWSTFQFEIIKAFRPSFERTLLKVGQQQQQQSSSFLSSHLHNQSQPTFDEKLQQTQKEQEVLPIPVSTSSEISPPSTVFNKELDHENHQINLVADNPIKLFEVLGDKCPCEHEPGSSSYMSVKINAPDWRIQAQCEDVSHDDEKLERQAEYVINSGSVQSTFKDVFKNIAESIGHLTAAYTNGITAISMNTQDLWCDEHPNLKPYFSIKIHTNYNWSIYNGPTYEDIALNSVSKQWCYGCKHSFPYHFFNGLYKLWLHFRKWKDR